MGPHAVRFACLAALLLALPALAQTSSTPEWISALRSGGHVIVFRHGATHNDQADTDPLNIQNVAKQRLLNDQGRALAKEIGDAMRALKIPVGEVRTSQFYRAVETGKLLGFGDGTASTDITEGGLVVSPNENSRRTKAMRALAAAAPAAGTNIVIVSHKPDLSMPLARIGSTCARARRRSSSRTARAASRRSRACRRAIGRNMRRRRSSRAPLPGLIRQSMMTQW